jgi:hypothetical protein
MSAPGLGCVKTKSDFVIVPSGRQIFSFFYPPHRHRAQIPGAIIPRRVFTHGVIPGSSHTQALVISSPEIDEAHPWVLQSGEPQWNSMSD